MHGGETMWSVGRENVGLHSGSMETQRLWDLKYIYRKARSKSTFNVTQLPKCPLFVPFQL
jgi:hypothetical protein